MTSKFISALLFIHYICRRWARRIVGKAKKWYLKYKLRPYLLDKAIREADRLHRQTGMRYRVFSFGYKYRVWNRYNIKERKRSGLLKDHLKVGDDFDAIAYYDTDISTNKSN